MLCEQSVITDNILQALSSGERLASLLPHELPARATIRVMVMLLQPSVDVAPNMLRKPLGVYFKFIQVSDDFESSINVTSTVHPCKARTGARDERQSIARVARAVADREARVSAHGRCGQDAL